MWILLLYQPCCPSSKTYLQLPPTTLTWDHEKQALESQEEARQPTQTKTKQCSSLAIKTVCVNFPERSLACVIHI